MFLKGILEDFIVWLEHFLLVEDVHVEDESDLKLFYYDFILFSQFPIHLPLKFSHHFPFLSIMPLFVEIRLISDRIAW